MAWDKSRTRDSAWRSSKLTVSEDVVPKVDSQHPSHDEVVSPEEEHFEHKEF